MASPTSWSERGGRRTASRSRTRARRSPSRSRRLSGRGRVAIAVLAALAAPITGAGCRADAAARGAQESELGSSAVPRSDDQVQGDTAAPMASAAKSATARPTPPSDARLAQRPAFADRLLDVLPQLREGITLGAWRAAHPADAITPYGRWVAEGTTEDWCVRAESEVPLDSVHTVLRVAYFYPPARPDPPALPIGVAARELVDGCRLGFLWIEAIVDTAGARVLAGAARNSISAALGAADTTTRAFWQGAASWRNVAFWRSGPSTIAAATTTANAWRKPVVPTGSTRVIIAATAPASAIMLEWNLRLARSNQSGVESRRSRWAVARARIEAMIDLAGLRPGAEQPVRSLLATLYDVESAGRFMTDTERSAMADVLDAWLSHAENAPRERRSAVLAAADLLIDAGEHAAGMMIPDNGSLRDRLATHGAEFDYSVLGHAHVYTHSWLEEALRIDPDGRAGEIALLRLMEMGFETSASCRDQGGTGFRTVIERAETHLRRRAGSAIETDIRFLLAEAYSDIVALANGGGYDGSESPHYAPEEAVARARAIEEYRTAFSRAGASARAHGSWVHAWRLIAGIAPTRTFFYCVYD